MAVGRLEEVGMDDGWIIGRGAYKGEERGDIGAEEAERGEEGGRR